MSIITGVTYNEEKKEKNGPGLTAPGMVESSQNPLPPAVDSIIQARLREFKTEHTLSDALECVGKLVMKKRKKGSS